MLFSFLRSEQCKWMVPDTINILLNVSLYVPQKKIVRAMCVHPNKCLFFFTAKPVYNVTKNYDWKHNGDDHTRSPVQARGGPIIRCACVFLQLLSFHYRSSPSVQHWCVCGRDHIMPWPWHHVNEIHTGDRWKQHCCQQPNPHTNTHRLMTTLKAMDIQPPMCLLETVYKHSDPTHSALLASKHKRRRRLCDTWRQELLTARWHICQHSKVNIHSTHPHSCLSRKHLRHSLL